MDELESFLEWFLNTTPMLGAVPLNNAVTNSNGITGVVWFREPPFQVEMFIAPPNCIIPEHTHPNVDSFEVYVGGQIMFSHSGKWVFSQEEIVPMSRHGVSSTRGRSIRVKPSDRHGGVFGPTGGVFMSVQHWLNGEEPCCISKDYAGIALDKINPTSTDAAHLEKELFVWTV